MPRLDASTGRPAPAPKPRPKTAPAVERPAPANRNRTKPLARHRTYTPAEHHLSTRQHRLYHSYGKQYKQQTGEDLRIHGGLMRALIEAGYSAHDLMNVANDTGNLADARPDRREPSTDALARAIQKHPHVAAAILKHEAAQKSIGGRGVRPPGESSGFNFGLGDAASTYGNIGRGLWGTSQDLGHDILRKFGVENAPQQSEYEKEQLQRASDEYHARFPRLTQEPGATSDPLAEAIIGGGAGGLLAGGLRAAGAGLAARGAGGLLGAGAAPTARIGTRAALTQPLRSATKYAARGPRQAATVAGGLLAAPAAAREASAAAVNLKRPVVPPHLIDNFGVAETAYAQGGQLSPQQKADILRQLQGGKLIQSQQYRDALLKQGRDNGWLDNQHTDDFTIIQHAMLGAPSGARRFLGRAFQDVAVLTDLPAGAQAAVEAAKQSAHQRSLRPAAKFAEEGFVNPTLGALQHPIASAEQNPLLTGTILLGAGRLAGGVGGRFVPLGEGVRHVQLPGADERTVLGPKSRNLMDRIPQALHDAYVNQGDVRGNALQRAGAKRGTKIQVRRGTKLVTLGQHRADVAAAQRTRKAEDAIRRLHPDVQQAWNDVVNQSAHHGKTTWQDYLPDFDHFIAGARHYADVTAAQIEKEQGKDAPSQTKLVKLTDRLALQRAQVEHYANLKAVWEKRKPNTKLIQAASGHAGEAEVHNIATIAGETGINPENLQIRRHADWQAFDRDLAARIKAEKSAALKAHKAAVKAHTSHTAKAAEEHAAAVHELEQARRQVDAVAATRPTGAPPRTVEPGVATPHPAIGEAERMAAKGIVTNPELHKIPLDTLPMNRNRRADNQAAVMEANGRVGTEIVTKEGEHGRVTAVSQINARGSRPKFSYEVHVVAKDGSMYVQRMTAAEIRSGRHAHGNAIDQPIQTGAAERAGFTQPKPADIAHLTREHGNVTYPQHVEEGASTRYVKDYQGPGAIGVATVHNLHEFGRQVGKRGAEVFRNFHVVARTPQGDHVSIPGAAFEGYDDAARFARELAQRVGEKGNPLIEAKKLLAEHEHARASAPEGFTEPAPVEATPVEQTSGGGQAQAEALRSRLAATTTPEHIRSGKRLAAKLRTQARNLEGKAATQGGRQTTAAVKLTNRVADAIIALGKNDALKQALKDGRGKSHTEVQVHGEVASALRAELRRIERRAAKTPAERAAKTSAKQALERMPQTAVRTRSTAAAAKNAERAARLHKVADRVELHTSNLEKAVAERDRAASASKAEGARGEAQARAQARVDAAQKRLTDLTERQKAEPAPARPERPDTKAIERRLRLENAQQREAAGATPLFRPHIKAEEGVHSVFPAGQSNRGFRETFGDVLGPSRLKRNDLQNIRQGKVRSDVNLTIRAMRAPAQAKELAEAGRRVADALGSRIEVAPGAKVEGVNQEGKRAIADSYMKLEEGVGNTKDAEALFDGMFHEMKPGGFSRKIGRDQVVVKTAADTYYVMPKEAVEQLKGWFADTMEKYNRPGTMHAITKAWRTQALNSTPTTPINNFLGNIVLSTVGGAGPLSLARALRATAGKGKWSDIITQMAPEERGSGLAGAASQAISPEHGIGQGLPGVKYGIGGRRHAGSRATRMYVNSIRHANIMAEDYGRLALWIKHANKEAKRQQYGPILSKIRRSNAETRAMIERGEIDFEKVHGLVNDFFGDMYKRGPLDRKLFLAVPFHRWFGHMVKLSLVTMPLKYPKRAVFLQELGQVGEDYRKEHGVYPDWMRGVILRGTELIPAGGPGGANNLVQHTIGTTGFNPFSSTTQIIGGGVGGGFNPVAISILSLLGEKHAEDFADLSGSVFGQNSARVRDLTDYSGDPVQRVSKDWLRAGAHEITGWLPIANKIYPTGGHDDTYIPGLDDKLPLVGRLGHDTTRVPTSVSGDPLPPSWGSAQQERGFVPSAQRFFGFRDQPFNVQGDATANAQAKQFKIFQQQAGHKGRGKRSHIPEPKS